MAEPWRNPDKSSPEHLRMATSLETRTYDILQEASLLNHKNMAGSKYVDLGAPPTAAEERTATTCKLMNHPRWMFHPVPDHHNKETQVWHLAPRIHKDPERNQTASNLRGEPQNKRPQTHQAIIISLI